MFTRKISPESFEQSIKSSSTNEIPDHGIRNMAERNTRPPMFDPDTGEMLQRPPEPPSRPQIQSPIHQSPPKDARNNFIPPSPSDSARKTSSFQLADQLPSIAVVLICSASLAWFVNQRITQLEKTYQTELKNLSEIRQGQNEILKTVVEFTEEIPETWVNGLLTSSNSPPSSADSQDPKSLVAPTLETLKPVQSKPAKKPVAKKIPVMTGVRYLGSVTQKGSRKIVIETSRGLKTLGVGEIASGDWHLLTIEDQGALFVNTLGNRQLIQLEQDKK